MVLRRAPFCCMGVSGKPKQGQSWKSVLGLQFADHSDGSFQSGSFLPLSIEKIFESVLTWQSQQMPTYFHKETIAYSEHIKILFNFFCVCFFKKIFFFRSYLYRNLPGTYHTSYNCLKIIILFFSTITERLVSSVPKFPKILQFV